MNSFKSIPEYIKHADKGAQGALRTLRTLTKKLAPKSEETISCGMPTIKLHGRNLIHFASMKGHFGFYPSPSGVEKFKSDLDKLGLNYSKGCIRFPYDKPLPISLITKIIKFRIKEENQKKK